MASTGRGRHGSESEIPSVSEPITLTDPDEAVTRVAPWSSWTREQVRRPGGESALVTRLDQGRLWFSSGRRKSPWLHEVHVGPAVVSTPGGRFQVTVEPDGGASVACLAGRTRVAAGLDGPVVLEPDQCAAVSSDGLTLVVLDRPQAQVEVEDPLEDAQAALPLAADADRAVEVTSIVAGEPSGERRRWWWVPELVAAAAVLAVLIAAIATFAGRGSSSDGEVAAPPISRSDRSTSTTSAPVRTTSTTTSTTSTTTAPTTTSTTTTTSSTLRPVSPGATGVGVLRGCRRVPGGVQATVRVRHEAGAPSRFEVTVAAIDRGNAVVAQAAGTTGPLDPGSVASIDVFVSADTALVTTCRVLGVASV